VEITSITLVLGMLVMMAIRVGRAIESTGDWIYLGFTLLTGYLTADFLSGVVHWAGDTLGDETTPVIGKNFVMPFRRTTWIRKRSRPTTSSRPTATTASWCSRRWRPRIS